MSKYLLLSKKTEALAGAVKKLELFGAPFWGVPNESPQKILGDKIAFAAQQLNT